MNWDAIGAVAELVGAAAVLATLIYLAVQTTLTRKAAEQTAKFGLHQATKEVLETYSRWRSQLIGTPELARILMKARGEALSDEEQLLFSAYFEELFYAASISFLSAIEGASLQSEDADVDNIVSVLRANPRALGDWDRHRDIVANVCREFVDRVDQSLT